MFAIHILNRPCDTSNHVCEAMANVSGNAVTDLEVAGFARIQGTLRQRPEVWRHQLRPRFSILPNFQTLNSSRRCQRGLIATVFHASVGVCEVFDACWAGAVQKKTLAESVFERATRLPFSNASTSVLIACPDFRKEHAVCGSIANRQLRWFTLERFLHCIVATVVGRNANDQALVTRLGNSL